MRTGLLKYFLLLIVTHLFISCEKEAKHVRLPQFEQKLAIAAFISPADSISVIRVSSNRRLYGELNVNEWTGNLSGTISDGSEKVPLDTCSEGLRFNSGKMRIECGKTYFLEVSSDKGLSAGGECTIPIKREFSIKADTFSILHQEPGYLLWRELKVDISFHDYPGEVNYYRLAGVFLGFKTLQGSGIPNLDNIPLKPEKTLFTDKETGSDLSIQTTSGINQSVNYYDSAFIKIYLFNTERSYYLYHKSLENYNSGDDPFSEVTPVYSNISGGLGIFTSYTPDSLTYRLK